MTDFFTTVPVAEALWNAPKQMGLDLDWLPVDPGKGMQVMVADLKKPSLELAAGLSAMELSSIASDRASVVNQYLIDQGFGNIQLTDIGVINRLYAAAVLKLLGEFFQIGESNYHLSRINKPAFRLNHDGARLGHFDFHGQHVVEIPTTAGFSLLVTKPTGVTGYAMVLDWFKIISEMKKSTGNGVVLPQISIDEAKIDVKPMVGMRAGRWVIQEALMAAKFALTKRMVKFEAAFAYSAKCLGFDPENKALPDDYLADHPLYFALAKRKNLLPLATGLVDVADMSNEKDLN